MRARRRSPIWRSTSALRAPVQLRQAVGLPAAPAARHAAPDSPRAARAHAHPPPRFAQAPRSDAAPQGKASGAPLQGRNSGVPPQSRRRDVLPEANDDPVSMALELALETPVTTQDAPVEAPAELAPARKSGAVAATVRMQGQPRDAEAATASAVTEAATAEATAREAATNPSATVGVHQEAGASAAKDDAAATTAAAVSQPAPSASASKPSDGAAPGSNKPSGRRTAAANQNAVGMHRDRSAMNGFRLPLNLIRYPRLYTHASRRGGESCACSRVRTITKQHLPHTSSTQSDMVW